MLLINETEHFGYRKYESEKSMLVKSVSIENMLNRRDAAMNKIVEARQLLDQAEGLLNGFGMGDVEGLIYDRSGGYSGCVIMRKEFESDIRKELSRRGWKYLMDESGLRTLMDAKRKSSWDEMLCGSHSKSAKGLPELNQVNIEATFRGLYADRLNIFEDSIIECFKSLSWNYKTNEPCKFGKKIILTNVCDLNYHNGFEKKWNGQGDNIVDLERVFHLLEGKPVPDHRVNVMAKMFDKSIDGNAIQSGCFEDEYFIFKLFKNGNAHVLFKNLELVEKMNVTLAKRYPNALPPKSK